MVRQSIGELFGCDLQTSESNLWKLMTSATKKACPRVNFKSLATLVTPSFVSGIESGVIIIDQKIYQCMNE